MKKLSFILLAVATAVAVACSGNQVKYEISGFNAPEDGAAVYLIDQITSANIDSTVVSGGAFQFKGKQEKDAYLCLHVDGSDWWFLFFNDGEPIKIDASANTLTGSALNNKVTECDKLTSNAYAEYNDFITAFEALSPEEQMAVKEEDFIPQYRAKLKVYSDALMGVIEDNMDNLVPVAFLEHVPSLFGEEKFNELATSDTPFAKHPFVQNLKRKRDESNARRQEAEQKKQAIIGQQFLDLEEPDQDGNLHKLSEYVGQGKWVLVDFWAAWCGPCHAEMPNVVAAYKKYHPKGFDVVGLSFDRNKEDWVKAIADWEMPWIHLSDLKYGQSVASDVYSVNSIPDNLLINPEGIVVARGLRGEALEAKLAEVFE